MTAFQNKTQRDYTFCISDAKLQTWDMELANTLLKRENQWTFVFTKLKCGAASGDSAVSADPNKGVFIPL